VLNRGVIQQIGTPKEIYERPANLFVADFMGSPPMNLIPGSNAGGMVTFDGGGVSLAAERTGLRDGNIVVGIRPEAFLPSAGNPAMTLTAASVENAGSDTYVGFALAGRDIVARLPGKMQINAGDRVPLDVDAQMLSFFDPATEQRIA
jgi:multiple sugar transport system ATP-binding protein